MNVPTDNFEVEDDLFEELPEEEAFQGVCVGCGANVPEDWVRCPECVARDGDFAFDYGADAITQQERQFHGAGYSEEDRWDLDVWRR